MLRQRLASLNIVLPPLSGPFGAYIPVRRAGGLVFVAGQLPMRDGKLIATGQVPSRCSIEQAQLGARQCVINALAAVQAMEGTVDVLRGVVRVGAFVSSDPTFTQQPQVANAASQLLLDLFGDAGRHARAAVGAVSLPLDAAVEIEFVFHT
jgi:enamine deaminase RidA (YjgF/YER057c/UK114 family)